MKKNENLERNSILSREERRAWAKTEAGRTSKMGDGWMMGKAGIQDKLVCWGASFVTVDNRQATMEVGS